MTPRIITADVARELLTAAPEGPYEACHPDDLPGRSVVVGGTEIRAPFDAFVVAIEDRERVSIANLLAAAPDLAHTVIAQAAELAALRAIIDGRTIPPTGDEIEAHHHAGGSWYVASTHGRALTTTRADAVALCAHLAASKYPATWWAISVRGRPCAWPVVAEVSR